MYSRKSGVYEKKQLFYVKKYERFISTYINLT